MNKKYIKIVLLYLQWGLIGLSLFSIIITFIETFSLDIDISSKGLQYYLSLYQPYSIVYAATFVVLSTNLAIEKLNLYSETNKENFKIGNRTTWIHNASSLLNDIKETDMYMARFFKRNIQNIHDYLFDINYKFENKAQLEKFIILFIKNEVATFEKENIMYKNLEGTYKDNKHNYSFKSFKYIFSNIVSINDCYKEMTKDLESIYHNEVESMNDRLVNLTFYAIAYKDYEKKSNNKNLGFFN